MKLNLKLKMPGRKSLIVAIGVVAAGGVGSFGWSFWGAKPTIDLSWLPFGLGSPEQHAAQLDHESNVSEGRTDNAADHGAAGNSEHAGSQIVEHEAKSSATDESSGAHAKSENTPDGGKNSHQARADQGIAEEKKAEGTDNSEHGGEGEHSLDVPEVPYVPPVTLHSAVIGGVRKLQQIQEKLAHGDRTVVPQQRQLLLEVGKAISSKRSADLEPAEFQASIIYLLSGGRPEVVEGLLDKQEISENSMKLLKGALAYSKGDLDTASEHLNGLETGLFNTTLASQIAMIQARVIPELQPRKRRELLLFTANSMVGTLLEEAALRRLMEFGTQFKDLKTFISAAKRYNHRFSTSVYSAEYRNALLSGIIAAEDQTNGIADDTLDQLIFMHDPMRRRELLNSLSTEGLRKGRIRLCTYASTRLRRIEREGSTDWKRATLYYLSCGIVHNQDTTLSELKGLETSQLAVSDQDLHRSALALAEHVRAETFPSSDVSAVAGLPLEPSEEDLAFQSKVLDQLQSSDQIIKESTNAN